MKTDEKLDKIIELLEINNQLQAARIKNQKMEYSLEKKRLDNELTEILLRHG